jgi:predicted permease
LFQTILNIIHPVILVIFIGYLWNIYNKDFNIIAVTKLVSNIALLCLVYDFIIRTNLTKNIFLKFLFVLFKFLLLVFYLNILIKIFKLPSIKLTTPIMHPNSGNMGLPLALLTLGSEVLALAVVFASIVMVSHFTTNSAIYQ